MDYTSSGSLHVIRDGRQVGVACTRSENVLFFTGLECFIIVKGIY